MGHDQPVGQASDQATVVGRVGVAAPTCDGQIPGRAHNVAMRFKGHTTREVDDTNSASQPQASHTQTYRRFSAIQRPRVRNVGWAAGADSPGQLEGRG